MTPPFSIWARPALTAKEDCESVEDIADDEFLTDIEDDSAPFITRLDCDRNAYGRSGRVLLFSRWFLSCDVDGGGIAGADGGTRMNQKQSGCWQKFNPVDSQWRIH